MAESMCYVGVKPDGCAVAALVDVGRREDATEIAKWMRSGLTIERHPVTWVRENLRGCGHGSEKKKSG